MAVNANSFLAELAGLPLLLLRRGRVFPFHGTSDLRRSRDLLSRSSTAFRCAAARIASYDEITSAGSDAFPSLETPVEAPTTIDAETAAACPIRRAG
jgi:hypothetical protein